MSNPTKTEYQVDHHLTMNGKGCEPGDKIKLTDDEASPLLATKPPVISLPGKDEETGSNVIKLNGNAPEDETERLNQIKAAVIGLDINDKTKWTGNGAPDANVLTELLGWKVSAAERDQAWKELQDSKDNNTDQDSE